MSPTRVLTYQANPHFTSEEWETIKADARQRLIDGGTAMGVEINIISEREEQVGRALCYIIEYDGEP